jgi:hypothetical protein
VGEAADAGEVITVVYAGEAIGTFAGTIVLVCSEWMI